MSFIERLNLLCPLFGVSFKRGFTVTVFMRMPYKETRKQRNLLD